MIRIGIVGLGYWGPNLVRAFDAQPGVEVAAVCDLDPARLASVCTRFPNVAATDDADELFRIPGLDAVAIVTPTRTHYALARRALEQGLHVFVEKPLASSVAESEALVALAEARGRVLFVGHIFLYTAAVAKLRELVEGGDLGPLCHITAARRNLGPVRTDVNALWDLAPHDISIVLHLLGRLPESVNCQGTAHLHPGVHDVTFLTMHFSGGVMASIHSSWLDPNKVREMTLVGGRKMVVYDELEPLEKIKIYDKGIDAPGYHTEFGEFAYSYRYGDTYSPRLVEEEPLKAECRHFVDCVARGERPRTDGVNGLEVVRVLEAAQKSLASGGGKVSLNGTPRRMAVRVKVTAPLPREELAVR
jgi:predicted dehydrogenase